MFLKMFFVAEKNMKYIQYCNNGNLDPKKPQDYVNL